MALWKKGKSAGDKPTEDDGLQQLRKIYHHPGYLSDEVLKQLDQQFSEGKAMVESDNTNSTENQQSNNPNTSKSPGQSDTTPIDGIYSLLNRGLVIIQREQHDLRNYSYNNKTDTQS